MIKYASGNATERFSESLFFGVPEVMVRNLKCGLEELVKVIGAYAVVL